MGNILFFEPSASVMVGFSTHILSNLILNSSTLCGMMVGSMILFSSMICWSSRSMNVLKDSMFEATKLWLSKYLRIKTSEGLRIHDTPVEYGLARCRAVTHDLDDIAC